MTARQSNDERLADLLADEALFGLEETEREELEELLAAKPIEDREAMQRTAALVHVAFGPAEYEPMPASLQERLRDDGQRWVKKHTR